MRKITLSLSLSLSLCNKYAKSLWRVLLLILFLSFHFVSCKKGEDSTPTPSTNASIENLTLKLDNEEYPITFDDKNNADLTFLAGTKLPLSVTIQDISIAPKAITTVKKNDELPIKNGQITFTVTAEDGITNSKYTITFLVQPSTGAEIKSLTLKVNENTYTPDFNSDTNVVITLVLGDDIPNEVTVTSLSLSENAKATVKQNDKLEIKNDQASIVVTSEDKKTTNTYTLSFIAQKLVRFDTDGGSAIPDTMVDKGQMLTAPAEPTKAGFTFGGWFTNSNKTTAFDFNTPITEDITLYARWKALLTVTVKTYTGTDNIGQGVLDESFAQDKNIITMENVPNGSWTIKFNANMSLTKTAASNTIVISKEDVSGLLSNSIASLTNNEDAISFTVSNTETSTGEILLPYSPAKIYTWEDLQAMRLDLSSDYTLMNDITVPDTYNFAPIKGSHPENNAADRYSGKFNGQEHTVTLTINRPTENVVGLFGAIGAEGKVESLGLAGNIAGLRVVGALAGWNYGSVSGVHTSAEIQGTARAGGLVGTNKSGARLYGYATGKVAQPPNPVGGSLGGLVGINESSATIVGYATGDVEKRNAVSIFGGLVGYNEGMVIGYATGNVLVKSTNRIVGLVGGLVGQNNGTIVGYAKGNVEGTETIGGLVGYSSNNAVATGYARGTVTNQYNFSISSGPVFGFSRGTQNGYYSGETGESVLTRINSNNLGTAIKVDASTTKANFGLFTFGTEVGQWTFVSGKWPAINLPPEVGGNYAPEDQPIDP